MSRVAHIFTEVELRGLLEREEGQVLEFKSLWDRSDNSKKALDRRAARDFVAESVAAFANSDGGVLVLGVDDDGNPSGHGYPDDVVADLLEVPLKRLQPAMKCRTDRITIDGHELLVIDVSMAPEAVMVVGNGFPYRVGDHVQREPQEVINARKQTYRRVGFEQRVRVEATLDDLDLDLARKFMAGTPIGKRPVEEVLERYGLVHRRAPGWSLTNAALLLFAREPALRWHPRAGIRFFRVDGTTRAHGSQRNVAQLERFDPPLASALPAALKFASTQVRKSEKLHDLFFRETPEYPEFAWQEAMVNAIAHRDYEMQGLETEVWFYDDRMEVKSPGDLVPPVTIEALRTHAPAHASRNPLLVRALVEAGVMRDEGEGIPRMFDEMRATFLRAPAFEAEHGVFTVTLSNQPVFEGPSSEWKALVEGLPIRVTQRRVLLARPARFTNEDYRELNQLDRDAAYREIQELVQAGVVVASGAHGRGAAYHVSTELQRTRSFLESRLGTLRRKFGTTEALTNADYRALFAVGRDTAKLELRALVQQGILRREGERRGARYLALPALFGPTGGARP